MITHLKPDILECEVKWALGSIITNKASGGDGIPVELFQILKDDAVKVHSICQHIWKTKQWPQDWKRSVFIPIPKKGNAKECSNCCTIALISHASKVILKILQARLQQYMNRELPDVQAGFRKGRGIRNQIANICWIIEKARKFQINIYFCFIDYTKAFDCVDQNKLGNSWRWKYQTTWPASWEICVQVKKQQVELNMEQWTGSKLGKEYVKAVYCHPAYLTYLQSISCKMTGWITQAGIKIAGRNINNLRYADDTTLMVESEMELKNFLMMVKGEWKSWFKTQRSKNEDHGIQSYHFMANRWGNNRNRLYFLGLQNRCGR